MALSPSAAILVSTFFWGTLWIPLRALDRAGVSGAWATTTGFLLPLVLLVPYVVLRRERLLDGGWRVGKAAFLMAAAVALYSEGLLRGQVTRVILLFYLTPVWSTLLGRALLDEPVTQRRVVTIVLGLAGMLVVFGAGSGVPAPASGADVMGLVAGFCWGWAMIYLRQTEQAAASTKVVVAFLFLAPLFFLFASLPGGRSWVMPSTAAVLASADWLLAFGLLWMLPVMWLTIVGGSGVDPGRAAILLMFEIVVGLATAAWLTAEPFGWRELAGATLIVSACGSELFSARGRRTASA